ncbi:SDR family oxidoreductase [Boseongicola aestuarii]|uniref:D-beta-hydroxybutyrate dehydrogenase n=1 Tax=Boseongicola aestuarii TaxID=1470561 RepID=A0A238IVX1_9RHOB|nr:SDR family oxidoreductase [Boseongicola aestuarii]SMX22557.1 D-beta-hydroxybutyrate dehydrogenase [Boseongicola aestuarii]
MSRRVIVTGGASGIGARIAERFAELGDKVAICDANPDAVAAFAKSHPTISAEIANVAQADAMDVFLSAIEEEWGGVDVVFANAGTGGPAARIEDISPDDWRDCLAVNLDGAFLTCRWAARVMRAQGSGLIVLTSSTSGQWGHPHRSPYATAKWGILGLMKTLAMELGPAGVRVNAICPGAVEGERMERMLANQSRASGRDPDTIRAAYAEGTSLRTWVTADDIADAGIWLASPGASKVTGQALTIDGHTETNSA